MSWKTDFELQRLLRLLTEQLEPGCAGQTLRTEDVVSLMSQIYQEGEKINLQVMKVMCCAYTEKHLRRYLEVHLAGVEYLQERLKSMRIKASTHYLQLFETFCEVLDGVSVFLSSWQRRCFGGAINVEDWMTKAEVMDLLCITESTFYRRKNTSNWKCKRNGSVEYYLKSSLFE